MGGGGDGIGGGECRALFSSYSILEDCVWIRVGRLMGGCVCMSFFDPVSISFPYLFLFISFLFLR